MEKKQVLPENTEAKNSVPVNIPPLLALGNKNKIPVNQYGLDGKFIQTFNSIYEASNATGIASSTIKLCLNGKFKQSGGYQWRKVVTTE